MYAKEDLWLMEEIFCLSNGALIQMVNRLFHAGYQKNGELMREWNGKNQRGEVCVRLIIEGFYCYEFCLGRWGVLLQLCARECGCLTDRADIPLSESIELREAPLTYRGEQSKNYLRVREFPGRRSVRLRTHEIILSGSSAGELSQSGLTMFLPFLFYGFPEASLSIGEKQMALQSFLIYDIVGTLKRALQEEALSVFDVQRIKMLCRKILWKLYANEPWMKDMGYQELVLKILDADLDGLERIFSEKVPANFTG